MPPEILWQKANEHDEIVPSHIKRVVWSKGTIAIEFFGHDDEGTRHEGILRLALKPEQQRVIGKYRLEAAPNLWEEVKFTVQGKFADRQFSTFEGEWRRMRVAVTLKSSILSLHPGT